MPSHVERDPIFAPLPLDVARAALLHCFYDHGRATVDLTDLEPATVPGRRTALEVREAWGSYASSSARAWLTLAGRIGALVKSSSLAVPEVLAWAFWKGYRDAQGRTLHSPPIAPTAEDLAAASRELYRLGAIDGWIGLADHAARVFAELTRPTGRATFSSARGGHGR